MNPTLVVLPTGFSIPDRDLMTRLKHVARKKAEAAILSELQIGSEDWRRALQGQAIPTSILNKILQMLGKLDDLGARAVRH